MSAEQEFKQKYQDASSTSERIQVAKQFAEKPKLVPITKKLDNGYKVTYYVGQKDVSVGNYPLAIDPHTAQSLANQWEMHLPTGKMVEDIHSKAYAEGTLVSPAYLSSSGFTDRKGKSHTAKDVVQNVGSHEAILEGARRVEEALSRLDPNSKDNVTVTNGKILIQPTDVSDSDVQQLSKVYFKGIPSSFKKMPDGKIEIKFEQQGIGPSPHFTSEKNPYVENCTFTRLVGDRVDVESPTGSKYSTTLASAMSNPNTYKAFANSPKKITSYKPDTSSPKEEYQGVDKKQEKGVLDTIQEGAKDLYEGAKKQVTKLWGKIFSQAEQFELMALSSLKDPKLQKLANQRTIKYVSRKRKSFKK